MGFNSGFKALNKEMFQYWSSYKRKIGSKIEQECKCCTQSRGKQKLVGLCLLSKVFHVTRENAILFRSVRKVGRSSLCRFSRKSQMLNSIKRIFLISNFIQIKKLIVENAKRNVFTHWSSLKYKFPCAGFCETCKYWTALHVDLLYRISSKLNKN
jgi:hypothetical protein